MGGNIYFCFSNNEIEIDFLQSFNICERVGISLRQDTSVPASGEIYLHVNILKMFEGPYYAFVNKVTRILDQETVLALGNNKTYGIIFFAYHDIYIKGKGKSSQMILVHLYNQIYSYYS